MCSLACSSFGLMSASICRGKLLLRDTPDLSARQQAGGLSMGCCTAAGCQSSSLPVAGLSNGVHRCMPPRQGWMQQVCCSPACSGATETGRLCCSRFAGLHSGSRAWRDEFEAMTAG